MMAMKSQIIRNYCFCALFTALAALTGCQKDSETMQSAVPVNYELCVSSFTKGALINTGTSEEPLEVGGITEFRTAAFNGSTSVFNTASATPLVIETVSYADGAWKMPEGHIYYWPQKTTLTFYAYANLPSVTGAASVSIASDGSGQTLSYSAALLSSIDKQKDILLGYYSGKGNATGTAFISFSHPLAAVRFKCGELEHVTAVSSISIESAYASGTCTPVYSDAGVPTFTWNANGSTTVSQTATDGFAVSEDALLGETFILIPQSMTAQSSTVRVTVKLDDGTSRNFDYQLTSGSWAAGHVTEYTISIKDMAMRLIPKTLEDWDVVPGTLEW